MMRGFFVVVILSFIAVPGYSQNLNDLSFGTDSTFEVLTWNIEHFPKDDQTTIDYVKQIIEELDVDVLALQEISDTVLFKEMVGSLQGYQGYFKSSWFAGLAYIYKSETVEVQDIYEIYTTSPYWSAFPRSPMVIHFSYREESYILINNHFKCCGDGVLDLNNPDDEETRRYNASQYLKDFVDTEFHEENVIVLGDLNDLLTDDPENNVFQMFLEDSLNYRFADMEIATGNSSQWSYPGWPSHLDHLLITNEFFDEMEREGSEVQTLKIDEYLAGGFSEYDAHISDHRPVGIKFAPKTATDMLNLEHANRNFYNFPNPFRGVTTFQLDRVPKATHIEIFNLEGKKVETIRLHKRQHIVHWKAFGFTGGVYIAKLFHDNQLLGATKMIFQSQN